MPMTKEERLQNARRLKDEAKARKLHAIAERRAKAAGMDKAQFIASIVSGKHRAITADDIANEPDPA